jgi:hypothetical protein
MPGTQGTDWAGLCCKLSKCSFGVYEIDFLGYIVNVHGVTMEKSRVVTILDWPEPTEHTGDMSHDS